jgi:hypothetical protein
MDKERISRCLEDGQSILVGTVDAKGAPSCCRGLALRSEDDLAHATVFVPMATSRDTIANLATTRRIAVVSNRPLDHCTTQLKGTAGTVRLATNDEAPFVRGSLGAFKQVLEVIGLPHQVSERVGYWPAFAIEFSVEEIYEQTPGPRAGSRLR